MDGTRRSVVPAGSSGRLTDVRAGGSATLAGPVRCDGVPARYATTARRPSTSRMAMVARVVPVDPVGFWSGRSMTVATASALPREATDEDQTREAEPRERGGGQRDLDARGA